MALLNKGGSKLPHSKGCASRVYSVVAFKNFGFFWQKADLNCFLYLSELPDTADSTVIYRLSAEIEQTMV
jgi:hypothetical protein